jgi:PST family polysaccharide transporter
VQQVEDDDRERRERADGPGTSRAKNLVNKAVRGAFWTIFTGAGARILGIVGTLAVTHYLTPEDYGEVSLAMVIAATASMLSNCGLSQYIASRPNADRTAVFHATFYYMLLGVLCLAAALVVGGPFGHLISAPGVGRYLPGLALAALLDRVVTIQDRIQVRDMRFRSVGLQRSVGELFYSFFSVGLAIFASGTVFGGGYALVWASLARSTIKLITLSATTERREWLEPCRITWEKTREFFAFGLPMSVATIAGFGSQKWDNLVFSHHFGKAGAGFYNLAYNFADIPTGLIGETVGDVLVPSFAHMKGDERKNALLLSLRTLSLLVAPLAVGLAAVAPTLVKTAFDERYEPTIHVLRIIAMFGIARTVGWICSSYLQVRNEPRTIMGLEILKVLGIVGFMHVSALLAARWDPAHTLHWACGSVVAVFSLVALGYMGVIRRLDGVPVIDQILPLIPPILACVPMVLAVYGVQELMHRTHLFALDHHVQTAFERIRVFGPRLIIEILVGAITFVPSALVISRRSTRELIGMIRDARSRRGQAPVQAAAA